MFPVIGNTTETVSTSIRKVFEATGSSDSSDDSQSRAISRSVMSEMAKPLIFLARIVNRRLRRSEICAVILDASQITTCVSSRINRDRPTLRD